MRIILLRILLGWWMIPFALIFIFPLFWLLSGLETAINDIKELSRDLWYGMDED